jgi:hypothetical protein
VSLQRVLEDVVNERAHQENRWGVVNDDRNTFEDWRTYMNKYSFRVGHAMPNSPTQRRRLIQVAALAVAAIESFDRNRGFPVPVPEVF